MKFLCDLCAFAVNNCPFLPAPAPLAPLNRAPSACPVAPVDGTWGCSTGVKSESYLTGAAKLNTDL